MHSTAYRSTTAPHTEPQQHRIPKHNTQQHQHDDAQQHTHTTTPDTCWSVAAIEVALYLYYILDVPSPTLLPPERDDSLLVRGGEHVHPGHEGEKGADQHKREEALPGVAVQFSVEMIPQQKQLG
jgi:hypothetical protein